MKSKHFFVLFVILSSSLSTWAAWAETDYEKDLSIDIHSSPFTIEDDQNILTSDIGLAIQTALKNCIEAPYTIYEGSLIEAPIRSACPKSFQLSFRGKPKPRIAPDNYGATQGFIDTSRGRFNILTWSTEESDYPYSFDIAFYDSQGKRALVLADRPGRQFIVHAISVAFGIKYLRTVDPGILKDISQKGAFLEIPDFQLVRPESHGLY